MSKALQLIYSPTEDANSPALSPDSSAEGWRSLLILSKAEARALLPLEQARRLCCLPLYLSEDSGGKNKLFVLLEQMGAGRALREIRFITGYDILWEYSEESKLRPAIEAAYRGSGAALSLLGEAARKNRSLELSKPQVELSTEHPLPLLLEGILHRAHYLRASDIHLEPQGELLRLRYRVDGRLQQETATDISARMGEEICRRIKVLCNLDISINKRPQEGSFTQKIAQEELRLRVSFVPQINGEKVVLRLLENHSLKELPPGESRFLSLGLSPRQERTLLNHLARNSGAILLAGPTGSGKSTLLYLALEYLNLEWRNIVTLEDPVERIIPGINQTEAKREHFNELLISLLRQDPDVVMIGEIREAQTANTALSAAITGHLMLSTVHANSVFEVITRLLQLELTPLLLATALKLVIAQRLIPLNCTYCSETSAVSSEFKRIFQLAPGIKLKTSRGCELCQGRGLSGRIGVFEQLPINERLQQCLYRHARDQAELLASLKEEAMETGFQPLALPLRELLIEGRVSPLEALRCLGIPAEILRA